MNSATLHLEAADVATGANVLRCDHPDGRISIRISGLSHGVWITGTPDELRAAGDGLALALDVPDCDVNQ